MIYKKFYIKYKMSEQINLRANNKDIDKPVVDNTENDLNAEIIPNAEIMPNAEIIPNAEDIEKKDEDEDEENKDEGENESNTTEIVLKLGDIILLTDPTNEILNNNVFLIEYIDPSKIKLINSETYEKTVLQISSEGIIGDGNIQTIKVISSNSEEGYARQNDLLPGTWINIYFGGEIPTVITGEITNLEDDMIEIKTTDDDTLFIDFKYQGVPEDIPIETFEIRPAISKRVDVEDELVELGEEESIEEEVMNKPIIKQKIQKMLFDMSDIEFGDIVNVQEYVNIDKDKYRYNIETQANDLLEEMISSIPNAKRTNNVLNNIHTMISRFIQLRQISSTFDINKNVTGAIKRTANDKPLAEYLSEFKNTLYWILLVASNVKKIYPSDKKDYGRKGDYETINETVQNRELHSLFKKYKSNQSVEGQNKYASLYSSLDPYMTPFYSINPEVVNNVFTATDGIIIEGTVESNVNVIINNLGDLYSSIVSKSQIMNRRFVIQRYNLGQERLQSTNLKAKDMVAHRVKLTNNDPISINSILTLPEPTVRFSQINLPGSNLLVKANLNMHFLNYWELLKKKTDLTRIVVDGLDNDIEYDDNNFVDNIKQYMLDLTEYNKPTELTNLDIYKIFLRTIVPKTRVLFSLVKKYIKGRLSLVDVVNYLEPFMIYPIDLTYMQYREINSFIFNKIKEYNSIYKEYSIAFSGIKYIKSIAGRNQQNDGKYVYSNELFNLLDTGSETRLKMQIFNEYGFDEPGKMTCSGSEFLKKITVTDYGQLYNTAVALTNIQLMYPDKLNSVFEMDKNELKVLTEKDKANDTCSAYIISKKYYSKDAMLEDDGKPIYFDKEYDATNYEIIEEKYKTQRDNLSSEEFIIFLTDEFINKHKMDEKPAEHMATTLVNQAKRVSEGDYAILVNVVEGNYPQSFEYYVRKDDTWVLDKELPPDAFIKDDDVLCNMDYKCMYNPLEKGDDKCDSTEVIKDTVANNALKQILDQFDKSYNISKDELNSRIRRQLEYFSKSFDKLQQIKRTQFFKYNNQKYDLGLNIADEVKERIVSPFIRLRDLIMGQNDFVKKQTDIIKFVSLYCREGDSSIPNIHDGEMENEWWMYCVETNTKLLPKFVYILANTFITRNKDYDDVLNDLKRQIGKRSDKGDTWVDENSGEVICYIDYDVSEGYKGGFADTGRDIIEKDVGEVILEKQQQKQAKRLSPEGEIVSKIVSVLSSNMGINIEQNRDFIIKIVTELISDTRILEKEPAYKKREDEAAKKGKKIPSYMTVYSSTIMYLTLGMYLIAVQTSIPSIKTRKTAPGCVRSFNGFPFEGEGDDSGLNYVACVALKSRDTTTMPWNSLPKNEEKIATTLKAFIIRYLIPYAEVEQKIKEKTEYLLTNPDQEVPEEHSLGKWTNFLPPLKRFHINNLDNVTNGFTEELQNEFQTGNYRQLEKLLVIDSKIISYSLAIQESIQKLIEKKDLLLSSGGKPFMDNACCNEKTNEITTLGYFINEDASIENYNQIVKKLSALVRDIKILTQGAIMLSEVNTKRIYPEVSNDFSEETIYQSFISLCNFQSSIPLAEDLATICIDKPEYLKKTDTFQEKMAKLKRDGRNYTKEQFIRLFQLVSRNNIIRMSMHNKTQSCVADLAKILNDLDVEANDTVPKALTQKLEGLVESYDVTMENDTENMRTLKNYLASSITSMRKNIINFIKSKSKGSNLELINITAFLNNLSVWRFDENKRNENNKISDDGMYNYINFYKNFINLFAVVFPSTIINKNIHTIEPPDYWGLTEDHEEDIIDMVETFYEPIHKFYGNNTINNVLFEIKNKCRAINLLSLNTPAPTNIKIGDKITYSGFEKRTLTLLYEYYFLSILTEYISLTNDKSMVQRTFTNTETEVDTYSRNFVMEQELKLTEDEEEYIQGDISKMKQDVAKLLVSYLTIMMKSKKTLNVSYDDIADSVFKLKEAEKYSFTDRLKDMTEEERVVDTILKHNKLGPLYSIGISKGIKTYDPDIFEHDRFVANKVAELQKKLNKRGITDGDMDMADAIEEMNVERDIEDDLANDFNNTDDYDDGDPWGEEAENNHDYD